jgi:hypothetical protein
VVYVVAVIVALVCFVVVAVAVAVALVVPLLWSGHLIAQSAGRIGAAKPRVAARNPDTFAGWLGNPHEGHIEGCVVSFNPESWVNDHVKACVSTFEQSIPPYSETERASWRRLASDLRMKEVYSNAYLAKRLTPQGWRIWIDLAQGWANKNYLKEERERLARYMALMTELDKRLDGVSSLIGEISNLNIAEKNAPRCMFDPLVLIETAVMHSRKTGDRRLECLFNVHIRPKLDALKRFDSRYLPTVPQMLAALSEEVFVANFKLEYSGTQHADPVVAAALVSRQNSPLPEYVRAFDAGMRWHEYDVGGTDFSLPADILATQAAVALNLNDVDKKQIISARKLAAIA